jgi:hypothetical protein
MEALKLQIGMMRSRMESTFPAAPDEVKAKMGELESANIDKIKLFPCFFGQ